MHETTRVFALVGDAVLRRALQQRWRGSGMALCGMHAEGGDSIVEEMARVRPSVALVDADQDGARPIVEAVATRLRVPVVALVRVAQPGGAALRPLEWGAVAVAPRDPGDGVVEAIEATVQEARHAQVVDVLENHFPLSGAFPDAAVFDLRRSLQSVDPNAKIVVIGAGVGGPMAMRRILDALRGQVVSPIVYVQRQSPVLGTPLAQWLEHHTGTTVVRAVDGPLELGRVAVVPPECDAVLEVGDAGPVLRVTPAAQGATSFDALAASAARVYSERAVAVRLSGQGSDGSDGLLTVRRAGGFTIVQDRSSSLVAEAPGHARDHGGAIECLPINEIAERIQMLMRRVPAGRA